MRRSHAAFPDFLALTGRPYPGDWTRRKILSVGPRTLPWAVVNRPFRAKNQPSAAKEDLRSVRQPEP